MLEDTAQGFVPGGHEGIVTGQLHAVAQQGYLLRPGERPTSIHLIIDGWAARYRLLGDGRRQITALFVPGDFCDLAWLREARPIQHVIALVPVRTAGVAIRDMRRLMAADAPASRLLWQEMLSVADASSEWLVNLGRKTAIERIAHLFCELTERIGRVDEAGTSSCEMPLTQADIADTTGLTAVHVNRVLQEMRAEGLIELHSRRLLIFDIERLRRISFFQPHQIDRRLKERCRSLVRIAGPA